MCIYTYVHNLQRMCRRCVSWRQRKYLYNAYSCTCTGAQNTCSKVHATPTAKKCTHIYTCTRMHTHTYTQKHKCASMTLLRHAEEWLLKLKIYPQTFIHININMSGHVHARVYPYIYTCRYIHKYMFIHTHTYTHIRTHVQHVHVHTRKHTCNDSAAATARRADPDAGSSARLFHSTQSTTFSTSNARTSLYPLPETRIPLNPPSLLSNISQNNSRTAVSAVLLSARFYCSRETKGRQRTTKPRSSPSHHHDSAPPRQHPRICTGAELIHPVDVPPKLPATEAILQNGVTFLAFVAHF